MHAMTEMDILGEANPDADALVILGVSSDGTDNDDRVAVSRSGYHQLTGGGKNGGKPMSSLTTTGPRCSAPPGY